ncbi:hypothetical protein ABVT39_011930 [Epinephelus coioides]
MNATLNPMLDRSSQANQHLYNLATAAFQEPVQEIQRWDKATKTYTDVERPYIVGTYNKYMGGVDLLDSFTAKYKFALKSRRWYMYIFWHTITLAVVNAWLLYKWYCQALKMPKKEILNMRKFQAQLASSFILVDTTLKILKRGRREDDHLQATGAQMQQGVL